MREKIRYYPQHSPIPWESSMETCGAACVLMLLDYYGRVTYPTQKMEQKLYSQYRVNGYKGMTGAAVANCLSFPKNGLKVHLLQSFRDRMDNRDGYFPEAVYDAVMASYEMHFGKCKERIGFSACKDLNTDFLKQELETGKKIVLECFVPEVEGGPPCVLHWVIVEGYDPQNDAFRVRDPNPRVKLLHVPSAELEAYMDTPIGKICITVSEKV